MKQQIAIYLRLSLEDVDWASPSRLHPFDSIGAGGDVSQARRCRLGRFREDWFRQCEIFQHRIQETLWDAPE